MKFNTFRPLLLGAFLFIFCSAIKAQTQVISEETQRNFIVVGAKKTAQISGKVALIVVKETANLGWEATKFTTKEVASPVAKTLLVKAPPKLAKFALKKSIPATKKVIFSYLKYKSPF